ncbi:hypothetical protein AAFF_G00148600 [Aldrovandia affinis]|uniref:Uncharacterized protein n=1 Tax=Aldrovandia affinis TaxID=143900 RepID=A0AAD7W8J0_9TELE|nr:hypothetical protein AAFF_G00148600 [Aldrovandia affinis]
MLQAQCHLLCPPPLTATTRNLPYAADQLYLELQELAGVSTATRAPLLIRPDTAPKGENKEGVGEARLSHSSHAIQLRAGRQAVGDDDNNKSFSSFGWQRVGSRAPARWVTRGTVLLCHHPFSQDTTTQQQHGTVCLTGRVL